MFLLHFPWAFVIKILERLLIPLFPVAVSDYLSLRFTPESVFGLSSPDKSGAVIRPALYL